MIGCRATADSSQPARTDIDDELAGTFSPPTFTSRLLTGAAWIEARWFTRAEVLEVLQHPRGTNAKGREARPSDVAASASDGLRDAPFLLPSPSAISGVLISNWAYQKE